MGKSVANEFEREYRYHLSNLHKIIQLLKHSIAKKPHLAQNQLLVVLAIDYNYYDGFKYRRL